MLTEILTQDYGFTLQEAKSMLNMPIDEFIALFLRKTGE